MRFRPPAQQHDHLAFGVELDHHVGAFVDGPDIVLRIDSHDVSEGEAVQAVADEAQKLAGLIEFKQARLVAAVVNKDVPFGIGGDPDALPEVEIRWKLQEVRHQFGRYFGHILSLGLQHGRVGAGP